MQSFTCTALLGIPLEELEFSRTRLSRSLADFSTSLRWSFHLPYRGPSTPEGQVLPVWALPLSLATTDGIISFSFPGVTEMFHFAPFCFAGL